MAVTVIGTGDRRCTWRGVCPWPAVAAVARTTPLGFVVGDDVCGRHLLAAEGYGYVVTDTFGALPDAEQRLRVALSPSSNSPSRQ